MTAAAAIRLEGVTAGYGQLAILHDVTLSIPAGKIIGVLGPNGAGKSTLLRTISRLTRLFSGQVLFGERPVNELAPHEVARLGLAHVPEGRRMFRGMRVRDSLMVAGYSRGRAAAEALGFVHEVFPRLRERSEQRSETLSGGEQQMLAIARALMMRPSVIMLDEPSQGLSPVAVQSVMRSIRDIAQTGTSVILVEQNSGIALPVIEAGVVVAHGRISPLYPRSTLAGSDILARVIRTGHLPEDT